MIIKTNHLGSNIHTVICLSKNPTSMKKVGF